MTSSKPSQGISWRESYRIGALLPIPLAALIFGCVLAIALPAFAHEYGPEAARAALTNFAVANGLEISLFASEPMIRNPTSMDIDERGRVWICEGVNYRSTFQPWGILQPAGDRIVILEDTNGDGTADKATTFYQGTEINSALGVCVLGNRTIVSCSPNVYIFTDTDGDGKADKKDILFTGIGGVDHDHGIHKFSFGPDGKLYFNFGNIGNQLRDKKGNPIIDLAGNVVTNQGKPYRNGMVFRCNLDGSDVEVLAHNFRNPYTVAVDSFGTLWQADNDDDGNRSVRLNYVMEYGNFGFGDELTGAGWSQPRANMEADIPHRHWHQNDPGVVPNLLITGFGAPTATLIYEGDLLPALHNQMIVADAGTRLIRGYPVQADGAGYRTEPVDLVSTPDTWFRPSAMCVAPDGSLYIADWNDAGVGGHNMADRDVKTMTGRIYRLAPKGIKPSVPKLNLKTAAGCVKALQSPNLSRRYLGWTALQSLPNHGTRELEKVWRNKRLDPRARARALFLLAQQKNKTRQFVMLALREPDPDLRITGLRIAAENKLDVIPYVRELVNDPSAQVRRECAIALRHSDSHESPQLWAALAQQYDGHDRWYLEALGIGADRQEDKFFDAWLASIGANWNTPAGQDIIWRSRAKQSAALLAQIILQPDTTNIFRYFRAFDYIKGPEEKSALISLAQVGGANAGAGSIRRRIAFEAFNRLGVSDLKTNPGLQHALQQILPTVPTSDYVRLVQKFHLRDQDDGLLKAALEQPNGEPGIEAARLILADGNSAVFKNTLSDTNTAPKMIEALGNTREKNVVPLLLPLVTDTGLNSATRRKAVHQLSQIQQGATALLQLAKNDQLPDDVKFTATMDLNRVSWPELRAQAAKLLPMPQGRTEPLPPVSELLRRNGDVARGAKVFARVDVGCINCHRVNDKGVDLGPGLSEIGTKLGKDALYEAILDPSAGIEFGYEAWRVQLKSSDDAVGIITSETDDEIVLKDARAISTHIKKSDIAHREKLKISLMPSGLQQTMSTQDLVDLVEYLSSLKKAGR